MDTISTSVGDIAYDSHGSGPSVVLLPSGAHHHHDYDEVRRLLPAWCRSISVDWPGHGASSPGNQPAAELPLTRMLEDILESLAPDGAVLAGSSIGGNVAARLAIQRPDLVNGLMLIDTGGFEGSPVHARILCALMSKPWFVRLIYPGLSWWYMRPRTRADRRARAAAVATTRTLAGRTAVSQMWHSFTLPEHDLRGRAGQITAPTIIIQGRRDPIVAAAFAEKAHDLIAGSKLVLIDSGHNPHTTDPATVAAELLTLLQPVPAVDAPRRSRD